MYLLTHDKLIQIITEVLFKSLSLSLVQMVNNSAAVADPLQSILWKIVFFLHGFKLVRTQEDITQTHNMKPSITNQPGNAQNPMNHRSSANNKERLLIYVPCLRSNILVALHLSTYQVINANGCLMWQRGMCLQASKSTIQSEVH